MNRRLVFAGVLLAGLFGVLGRAFAAADGAVVVVPIHGTIDAGMAHLVERAVTQARDRHARAIVLDVDTFGGLVDAAVEIRDALVHAGVPVDAYVSGRAWSAGALVTLAADRIVMAPGASIGAAEPIPKTDKTVSALRSEFAATAMLHHRDRNLAAGMVDSEVAAPPFKRAGQVLTLTSADAIAEHIAEATAPDQRAALAHFGLANLTLAEANYSVAEAIARFATNPEVSGFLLSIGFLGLLLEMQTLHGIAGTIGVLALGLFFGTHVYAGFSNGFVIALALLGVLGILLELHVLPGHGIAGTVGTILLAAAVILAFGFEFVFVAIQSLAVAIIITVVCFIIATRIHPENAFVKRLAFVGVQGPDYVASDDHRALLGRLGYAASLLRPAGVATIDGRRVDVLTEGDFVTAGTPVEVVRVEGARIFVKPVS